MSKHSTSQARTNAASAIHSARLSRQLLANANDDTDDARTTFIQARSAAEYMTCREVLDGFRPEAARNWALAADLIDERADRAITTAKDRKAWRA